MPVSVDFDAPRFTAPILTVSDVAWLVGMPRNTAVAWAGQRGRPGMFTTLTPAGRGRPSVPLVGLAEAASLRALKQILPAREVRVAADFIQRVSQSPYPLAHRRLVTDGATTFLQEHDELVRLRDGQGTIGDAFRDHLRPLVFLDDDYPTAYNVPQIPGVQIHPLFNAGRMSFKRNRVPLFAIAGLIRAGEDTATIAREFRLDSWEVDQVVEHIDWPGKAA